MTRRDTLQCVHEPLGDAFYFGPERLGERFMNDTAACKASGSSEKTYQDIFSSIMEEGNKEVRLFLAPGSFICLLSFSSSIISCCLSYYSHVWNILAAALVSYSSEI